MKYETEEEYRVRILNRAETIIKKYTTSKENTKITMTAQELKELRKQKGKILVLEGRYRNSNSIQ